MSDFHISKDEQDKYLQQGNLPISGILQRAEESLNSGGKFIIEEIIPGKPPIILEVIDTKKKLDEWKKQFDLPEQSNDQEWRIFKFHKSNAKGIKNLSTRLIDSNFVEKYKLMKEMVENEIK